MNRYYVRLIFYAYLLITFSISQAAKSDVVVRCLNLITAVAKTKQTQPKIQQPVPKQLEPKKTPAAKKQLTPEQIKAAEIISKLIHRKKAGRDKRESIIETKYVVLKLDNDGYPTNDAIKGLLIKNFFPNDPGSLVVETIRGGSFSAKMYQASITKPVKKPIFFLKISRPTTPDQREDSAARLKKLQESNIGRLGIETRYADSHLLIPRKDLPNIVWLEKIYYYLDKNNKSHTIELSHSAKGQQVYSILEDFSNAPLQKKCLHAIGTAIGSFQQAFMDYHGHSHSSDANKWTTVGHKDLHVGNIFFDPKTSKVSFIDVETMRDGCSLWDDIDYLLFIKNIAHGFIEYEHFSWWSLWAQYCLEFFKGYIESFPNHQKAAVAQYLSDKTDNFRKYNAHQFKDLRLDKKIQKTIQGYFKIIFIKYSTPEQIMKKYQTTSLHIAVAKGLLSDVQQLLNQKVNRQQKDIDGNIPLDLAIFLGDQNIIKLLATNNPQINAVDKDGYTPLTYAINIDDAQTVTTLLQAGADVNTPDAIGQTPIMQAVRHGNLKSLQALLQSRTIDLNVKNVDGNTPLAVAVYHLVNTHEQDFIPIIKALLRAGADTTIKNNDGKNPLDLKSFKTNFQHDFAGYLPTP